MPVSHLDVASRGVLYTLLLLMAVDIVMGLMAAFITKELNSTVSWRGVGKKVGTLLLVCMCALLDPYIDGIAPAKYAALWYCTTEAISVLEKAGKLGIPFPPALLEALQKVRGSKQEPTH